MSEKPRVEYVPPDTATLRAYARAVCESFAQKRDNPALASPEVVSGLTHFLEVITRIQARHLSRGGDQQLDDASV